DVAAEDGLAFHAGYGFAHDRVVLVRRGNDFELAAVYNQPGPTAAEAADPGSFKFFFESVEAAEGRFDIITEFAAWSAAGFGREEFPKHRMIGVAAAVVAHRAADVRRHGVQVADKILDRFCFQVGLSADG